MKTIQINIRVSESLVDELEEVCSVLKVSKADWIRITLAREVFEERNKLLNEVKELEDLMNSDVGRVFQKMRARRELR